MSNPAAIVISATDKTAAAFQSVDRNLKAMGGQIGKAAGLMAGLAGATGFGMLVKNSMASADAMAKTSDALGIATGKLATLRYMGDLAGVSAEQMDINLKKMSDSLGAAANGGGAAAKTLENLHLNARELIQLAPDQQYLKIADAINGLGTQAEKAAAANDVFGRSGVNMLNVMADGAAGFSAAEAEATKFGIAISRVDAAKIEAANDAFTKVGYVAKGMSDAMAVTVSPMLEDIAKRFVDMMGGADGFRLKAQFMVDVVINGVGLLADGFHGLQIVFEGIGAAFWTVIEGFLKGLDWMQHGIVDLINVIPGIDVKPMQKLTDATATVASIANVARTNLQNLALEPLPSDSIKQWSQAVQLNAQKAAEAVAAAKGGMGGGGLLDTGGDAPDAAAQKMAEKQAAAQEREQAALQQKLAKLQEHYLSESGLLTKHLEDNQFLIEESFQNGLISDAERNDLQLQTAAEYETGLSGIKKKELEEREALEAKYEQTVQDLKSSTFNHAMQLMQALAGKSKNAAQLAIVLQKGMTIAQIKMTSAVAANAALMPPPIGLGPLAGVGLAASIKGWALADMAMVAGLGALELSGSNTGSSSGGSAGGGSAAGMASSPGVFNNASNVRTDAVDQRSGSINIYMQGLATEDMVLNYFLPIIQDGVQNRDVILIRSDSRNGQILSGS